MKVGFSGPARADLRQISARIAADNPARAASFVRELRERCGELSRMHLMFPIVPRRADGMRRRVVDNYSIFYLTEVERIVIARVLHNARDIGAILGDG
jgi:toxin ParE1/3/4